MGKGKFRSVYSKNSRKKPPRGILHRRFEREINIRKISAARQFRRCEKCGRLIDLDQNIWRKHVLSEGLLKNPQRSQLDKLAVCPKYYGTVRGQIKCVPLKYQVIPGYIKRWNGCKQFCHGNFQRCPIYQEVTKKENVIGIKSFCAQINRQAKWSQVVGNPLPEEIKSYKGLR